MVSIVNIHTVTLKEVYLPKFLIFENPSHKYNPVLQNILIQIVIFWMITPHILVGVYQRFKDFARYLKAAGSPEMMATTHETVRCHKPEYYTVSFVNGKNLKSDIQICCDV
jgi:hypothetical protein